MRKEDISDALSGVDADIIEEAAARRANGAPAVNEITPAGETAPAAETVPAAAPAEGQMNAATVPVQPRKKRAKLFVGIASGVAVTAAAVAGVIFVPKLMGQNEIATTHSDPITTTAATAPDVTDVPGTPSVSATGTLPGQPQPEQGGVKRYRAGSSLLTSVERIDDAETQVSGILKLKISTSEEISESVLREHFRITELNSFFIEKESGKSYFLRSDKPLEEGIVVNFLALDDEGNVCDSWAFESAQSFGVDKVYPADGATYVASDTGIEITFTEAVSEKDIDSYISISPAAIGKFSVRGRTVYFIPDDMLGYENKYTVTVKKGLTSALGKELEEDYTFSFSTGGEYEDATFYTQSTSSGFSESFLPDDRACVQVQLSWKMNDVPVQFDTHLYRFDSADAYYAAVKARAEANYREDEDTDVSGLTEVFSSDEAPFVRAGSSARYILLPDELDEGYYVADITLDGSRESLQYLLEVSPLSVYAVSLGEENVIFVNRTSDGKPAAGATVTIEADGNKYTGKVGSDGIAKINTKGESGRAVLDISDGSSGRYIDCIMLSGTDDMKFEDLYYTCLHTDRTAYLPTDTIYVWGAVIPRAYGTALPDGLALRLTESEYTDVKLASDGTFSAEIKIKDHEYAWSLALVRDEKVLDTAYISIREYEKPTYVLDAEAPEYALFPQEVPVPITLSASYFEGTPAEGVKLKNSMYYDSDDYVVTGADGTVRTETLTRDAGNDWHMSTAYISYTLAGIENTYAYAYVNVPAFFRDVMLNYDYDEDSRSLSLNTYKMDFSRIDEFLGNREPDMYGWSRSDLVDDSYEILKGAAYDASVDVKITHHWSEKKVSETYYDYIEKKTVPVYSYEYKDALVASKYVKTGSAGTVLKDLPIDDPNGYYDIEIKYKDTGNREVVKRLTVYAKGHKEDSDIYYYRVGSGNKMFMLDSLSEDDYTAWYGGTVYFTEGEKKNFKLICSDTETKIDGKLLLAVYRSDIVSCDVKSVTGSTDITIDGTRDLIPDARYAGAYFDGKHVYRLVGGILEYDPSERDITLEASSDDEKYDAGDTVKIKVKATDKNGRALSDAIVHMSIVDEAAFAIEDQYADILRDVYSYIWYPEATEYVSYIQHLNDETNDGGKGAGGEESVRRDFRDTAYFDSAVTDSNGYAEFEVKMPDNLTTWRATMLALYDDGSERLYAGTSKMPIVTTRSLFITPIMQKEFVEGDDIAVSANCAGLGANGYIDVSISGKDTDIKTKIKPKETANFGKLAKGSYTVRFAASNATGSDAVEMPVTVTDTLLETHIVKGMEVSEISGISPTKYPINISFFDKEYLFCTEILRDLMCYYGNSLDMRMASAFAEMELGYITQDELAAQFVGETADGFARQLPAASPDNEMTALMCAAMPEAVNKRAAKQAFYNELDGDLPIRDVCIDYMGLAALGEPVLSDVKALYNSGKVESAESGIYLAAAFALCGDYRGAYDVYMKYVPEIKTDTDSYGKTMAWIDSDGGQKFTAAALITASVIDLPEAECFARYLISDGKKYDLYALQLVVYLRNYVPSVQGDAVVTYTLNGKKQNVKLNRHFPTTVQMTEEQFRNANFGVASGSVYALVRYTGKISENTEAPTLSVTKKVSGDLVPGGAVTVSISAEPYSLVYDVVPSCGRFVDSVSGSCYSEGQLVRVYTDKNGNASYTFTANVSGNFVLESAVTYNYLTGAWGKCSRSDITIR